MTEIRDRYGYPFYTEGRDLRFDFMRGFAMLLVVAAHFEAFSLANFLFWERLGIFSGAGMFVVASGLVVGLVNRMVIEREGLQKAAVRLLRRSFLLYRVQVAVVLLVVLIARLDLIDMTAVTTFTDRWADLTYKLIPAADLPWRVQLAQILLLRTTPHQIQILSLYVLLLAAAPAWLWLLRQRLFGVYFALSWALYFVSTLQPDDVLLLGMQFEFAFPILTWQILFTHALALGYFYREIRVTFRRDGLRRLVILLAAALALAFFVFAQAAPSPSFPSWFHLPVVPPEQFQAIYHDYFLKDRLGLGRLLNVTVFFVTFYTLLTYFWRPISRALGWLLIPLGENSLYVFVMHLVFIVLIDQIPGYFDVLPAFATVWPWQFGVNTALYVGTILSLWVMVKRQVLFSVIPR